MLLLMVPYGYAHGTIWSLAGTVWLRPISLLTLRLLRLLDSNFPGNPPRAWEFPPLRIEIVLESNPLTSTMLVGRMGVIVVIIIIIIILIIIVILLVILLNIITLNIMNIIIYIYIYTYLVRLGNVLVSFLTVSIGETAAVL